MATLDLTSEISTHSFVRPLWNEFLNAEQNKEALNEDRSALFKHDGNLFTFDDFVDEIRLGCLTGLDRLSPAQVQAWIGEELAQN